MAPLTVGKESLLEEPGNYLLTSIVFHRLAGNFFVFFAYTANT